MEKVKEIQKTELKKDVSLGQKQSQEVLQKESNDLQEHVKELTEENEMLFEQLHIVQEELEKYYYKLKDAEKHVSTTNSVQTQGSNNNTQGNSIYTYVSSPEVTTENIRLKVLSDTYSQLRKAEIQNSLQYRIGNAIMKLRGTGAVAPFKLMGILSFFTKNTPPAQLGDKDFTKVIEAYGTGGNDAVEKLLDSVKITSFVKANAYTAIAKHLRYKDLKACCAFAERAYTTDPQAYRLKWWILRLDDRGDYFKAEALLALLPPDTPMNDMEKMKIESIRKVAPHNRKSQSAKIAKESVPPELAKTNADLQKQLGDCKKYLENHKKQLGERTKDLENHKKQLSERTNALENHKKQLAECNNDLETIKTKYKKLKKKYAKKSGSGINCKAKTIYLNTYCEGTSIGGVEDSK